MLLVVRSRTQRRREKTRTAWQTEQVPALLPLLQRRGRRPGLCTLANLVSVHRPCGDEWSGVAGPAHGPCRHALPAAGQLFSLDRRVGPRPRASGRAIADGLAGLAGPAVASG